MYMSWGAFVNLDSGNHYPSHGIVDAVRVALKVLIIRSGDVVTHHVDVSSDPNRVGKSIDRTFAIRGDRIVLTTPPTSVGGMAHRFTLTWRRAEH